MTEARIGEGTCGLRSLLEHDGFVVIRNVFTQERATQIGDACAELLPQQANFFDTTGSIPAAVVEPLVAASQCTIKAMEFPHCNRIGPTFINKKPHEPARSWHGDWRWWDHPVSGEREPVQVGVIFSLRPTSIATSNGCLRVLPGTHLRYEGCFYDGARGWFDDHPDQVVIETAAGDVTIIDSRILHGTLANETDMPRESVNCWCIVREFDYERPHCNDPRVHFLPEFRKRWFKEHPKHPRDFM